MNLSKAAKATRVSNSVAAGQTTVDSSSVDMQGFAGAEFLVSFGAISAGALTSIKLQGSADDSVWSDLEGTGQTVADVDDNQIFVLDAGRLQHRYLRCVVSRGTQNAELDGIVALQYDADEEPVTHDVATVGGSEHNHAPPIGTP